MELRLFPHQIRALHELNVYPEADSSGLMSELICPQPYSTFVIDEKRYAELNSYLEPDYNI